MDTWFPTFRRWLGMRPGIPFQRPWRTSLAQRQSLLRLIVVAVEENLPLGPLIESWAADETGGQKHRLVHLAKLLQAGKPLADAVEEVHGVLGDEDILAIRFGAQSGTLVASIRDRLDEPHPAPSVASPRWRKSFVYFCLLICVAFFIVAFLQIKIVPEFNKIMEEFSMSPPESLKWSVAFANFFVDYWYLFALPIMALCWMAFTSTGRRVRLAILRRLFQPLGELNTADVLQKLSIATHAGRPISGAISTLARYHFDSTLRRQLLFIRNEMEQGADVWQSMASIGLLKPPEVRVLETAERVGNRPWVLRQLAQLKKQRTRRSLAQLSEAAFPLLTLLMGAFVLFQAVGVFGSLVQIIYSLM
jgi:MSHA biogenesis protein MshG